MAAVVLGSSTGLAAGDAAAGRQLFASHCGICHATEPGVNKIGPSLAGVVGRKSGTEAGFNYSPALKAAAITGMKMRSTNSFKTSRRCSRTKMVVSVPGNDDRQNVIAYLKTLKP
jgi:cytochrome c